MFYANIFVIVYAIDTFWPGILVILLMGTVVYIIDILKLEKTRNEMDTSREEK